RLRTVVGGEHVRLIRQYDELGATELQVVERDLRITFARVGVHVVDAELRQHVTGKRVATHDHPRSTPDADNGAAPQTAGRLDPTSPSAPEISWIVPPVRRPNEQPGHSHGDRFRQ